ncbi:phosphoribosyltransferase [Micromonospora sp. H61]|nr:phosphoribosyltransferase [Micromonospora sp. H61]
MVAPIAYSPRTGQHHHHLRLYKSTPGSAQAHPHPLQDLIGDRLGLPWLTALSNPRHGSETRTFQRDWFTVQLPVESVNVRPLVLDDTWTTGSRAQSLAYALKSAGASSVAVVVLGRHIRPEHAASRPLLKAIEDPMFDPAKCAVER